MHLCQLCILFINYEKITRVNVYLALSVKNDPGQEKMFVDDETKDVNMTICCGKNALFSWTSLKRSLNELVIIANPDRETKRIVALGAPLTLSAVAESLFDAIQVALVSNYLGVDALSAYVVANLLIGLSETFIGGVADALNTVCSHAIGAENYDLAGQYVQIASVVYVAAAVPIMGIWWFLMDDCLRLFGLNDNVIAIGAEYSKIAMFTYIVEGVFEAYTALLDISGYALQATIFDILTGALDCILLWVLLSTIDNFNLFWVGVTSLCVTVFCFVLFTVIAVLCGWLDPFWNGMIKTFALSVRYLLFLILQVSV